MDPKIEQLKSTTFGGRKFSKHQIQHIQQTAKIFGKLSRKEFAQTICEQFSWVTPSGANKVSTCLNALEKLETLGILQLPEKLEYQSRKSKELVWTDESNPSLPINCSIKDLMPISLQLVTEPKQKQIWNEFIDRYHYLGYSRPFGLHLRYFVVDREGRKLGCLLFSFASHKLTCRDEWIGWSEKQREKNLNLVINNARFLIFPWVDVAHLASKTLAYAMQQVSQDWASMHGYKPVLVESFVDISQYQGTCYKASNWEHVGQSNGKPLKTDPDRGKKDVYLYAIHPDAREILINNQKPMIQKVDTYKTANISLEHEQVYLWQKIITVISDVAERFDQEWQKRKRALSTLLVILFIFRLVFSKNKQGYGTTIAELWEYCHKLHIHLPQKTPVVPSTFCDARKKMDASVFKRLNTEIIDEYKANQESFLWKNHRLFAVDGSKVNLPKELIKDGYQKISDNMRYPLGLVSCIYQLKSKIPYDFDLVSHLDERLAATEHLKTLHENDLIIYDRGYFSYAMLYTHYKKDLQAVFRLSSSSYKLIKDFMDSSDNERLISIIPTSRDQKDILKKYPDIEFIPLQLRLIRYTINNADYFLGTNLLCEKIYSRQELSELYHSRWGVEEMYKISKLLIDVEDFHAKTELGVKQELFAHFVMITLSRIFTNGADDILLMQQKSKKPEDQNLCQTNFKNCLTTLARNLEALLLRQVEYIKESVNIILDSIVTCYQKTRPGRSYERISHKIPQKWRANKKSKKINAAIA
ncbi:MAG: hypothetical protein A3E88_02895 [Legionellales bacterium RIFCSPHIGHO2_12_FULL_35_11]|nr:MAG: hypothetical protein A3E88_02895 [Legionellales bacterium RIFCSPHIGHO2_12_FULL_35_11]